MYCIQPVCFLPPSIQVPRSPATPLSPTPVCLSQKMGTIYTLARRNMHRILCSVVLLIPQACGIQGCQHECTKGAWRGHIRKTHMKAVLDVGDLGAIRVMIAEVFDRADSYPAGVQDMYFCPECFDGPWYSSKRSAKSCKCDTPRSKNAEALMVCLDEKN